MIRENSWLKEVLMLLPLRERLLLTSQFFAQMPNADNFITNHNIVVLIEIYLSHFDY